MDNLKGAKLNKIKQDCKEITLDILEIGARANMKFKNPKITKLLFEIKDINDKL